MIHFIYGDHGTGKTVKLFSILAEKAAKGEKCVLLVPEQHSVAAEMRLYSTLPEGSRAFVEVSNFTRLADDLSRQVGGIVYDSATEGERKVVMQRALLRAEPTLHEYGKSVVRDRKFADAVLRLADELRTCGTGPSELEKAASSNASLNAGKFRDLSTIISYYNELLRESFSEKGASLERLGDTSVIGDAFRDTCFFLDSFSGLTGTEHRICAALMACGDGFYMTLPLPSPDFRSADTVSLRRMSDRLRADASRFDNFAEVLDKPVRFKKESLKRICSELWTNKRTPALPDDGGVRIICVADRYDESECAASVVRSLAEKGVRYRDVAIIAGNAENYRGIIDRAFEDAGVPLFYSIKIPLSQTPPSRFLLSALRVISGGWRRDDVVAFIKTGLLPFTDEETDLFELYTEKWKIDSGGFSREWNYHPDGFVPYETERSKSILQTVNRLREWLRTSLEGLSFALSGARDPSGAALALYELLQSVEAETLLYEKAQSRAAEGRTAEAALIASSYRGTVEALDEFCAAYGKETPDARSALNSLSVLFDSKLIGTIPDSSDSVTFGSARSLRADSPKYTLILGADSGVFPAPPASGGLIDDDERTALEDAGLPLMRDGESAASDEFYYFRRAVASASEGVVIFTTDPSSSIPVIRIKKLVDVSVENSQDLLEERITSPRTAAAYEHLLSGTPLGAALSDVVGECRADGRLPASSGENEPLLSVGLSLTPESAELIYPREMTLSQSQYETFGDCPMKYLLNYKIGLNDGSGGTFSAADAGGFVHLVLEKLIKKMNESEGRKKLLDFDERRAMADEIAKQYVETNMRDAGKYEQHIVGRLSFLASALAGAVAKDLDSSKFRPVKFEFVTGPGKYPPLVLDTPDGGKVSLIGKIDRIDVYNEGGNAWIRAVDYKTGTQKFKISEEGEVTDGDQLLFYLFNLTRGDKEEAKRIFGGEPKEASVEYTSSSAAHDVEESTDAREISDALEKKIAKSGCIIDDETVLTAAGRQIPPGQNKSELCFVSQKDFDRMFESICKGISGAVGQMKSGYASAAPSEDACKYCSFSTVCRSKKIRKAAGAEGED